MFEAGFLKFRWFINSSVLISGGLDHCVSHAKEPYGHSAQR